jgi:hypothetical protein
VQRPPLPDRAEHAPRAGEGGVNEVAAPQHHPVRADDGEHDGRELAALALVAGDGEGRLELIERVEGVLDVPALEVDGQRALLASSAVMTPMSPLKTARS